MTNSYNKMRMLKEKNASSVRNLKLQTEALIIAALEQAIRTNVIRTKINKTQRSNLESQVNIAYKPSVTLYYFATVIMEQLI